MGKGEIIVSLILFGIILIAFIVGIVAFVIQYRLKKKLHHKELENRDEIHKQDILETQVEIQTQTMKHIGREIHDNIGQRLTLASLYAQQLILENKTPSANESVNNIGTIIDDSLQELRELSKFLTSDSIKQFTLTELITAECEKLNNLKTCKVSFSNHTKKRVFSYKTKSILFRISQEFFQNSIKHAECQHIWVTLSDTKNGIMLVLEDDGKGFDMNLRKDQGIGLRNMKKRTQILGGDFSLESQSSKGTKANR